MKKVGLLALILLVAVAGMAYMGPAEKSSSGAKKRLAEVEKAIQLSREAGFDKKYAILINMGLPSHQKRLQVVDLQQGEVIYRTLVSHGKGSGFGAYANRFSNEEGSLCTSLGRYQVDEEYHGKHGKSYRLLGMDQSNDRAYQRAIVIHAADYVSEDIAKRTGRIGNSHGCPAVSPEALQALKPFLLKGTLLWIYK